jgi:DNA-binding GntR family transcriptional regulator
MYLQALAGASTRLLYDLLRTLELAQADIKRKDGAVALGFGRVTQWTAMTDAFADDTYNDSGWKRYESFVDDNLRYNRVRAIERYEPCADCFHLTRS